MDRPTEDPTGAPVDLDLLDPAARDDPYPALAHLRRHDPVRSDGAGTWTVSRYDDVSRLLRDRRLGRAPRRWHGFAEATRGWADDDGLRRATDRWLLFLDPPAHTTLRAALSPAFTTRAAERHRPTVEAVADELLDALDGRARFDLLAFAKPFPLRVLCRLLGIEGRDRRRVQRWLGQVTSTLARRLDPAAGGPAGGGGWSGVLATSGTTDGGAAAALDAHLLQLVQGRRLGQRGDAPLLDDLIAAGLDDDELVAAVVVVLVAGHETVANAIANAVLALLRHPDAEQALRGDRSLLPTAAEELVRYDGPANVDYRIALEPLEVGGRRIEPGDLVLLSLAAANRDPETFPNPDELVLDRSPNPHLGYGAGIHRCLGVWLARLEVQVALDRLLHRLPVVHVDEQHVVWRDVVNLRALGRLPLVVG